jgi:hypothetical protein
VTTSPTTTITDPTATITDATPTKTSAVAKEACGRYVEGTAVAVRQLRSVREVAVTREEVRNVYTKESGQANREEQLR